MDIYDINVSQPNSDILYETVKGGQEVVIVRMVTISYKIRKEDLCEILDGLDESEISVENLIEGETDNTSVWELPGLYDECVVEDDLVISVEIN